MRVGGHFSNSSHFSPFSRFKSHPEIRWHSDFQFKVRFMTFFLNFVTTRETGRKWFLVEISYKRYKTARKIRISEIGPFSTIIENFQTLNCFGSKFFYFSIIIINFFFCWLIYLLNVMKRHENVIVS